MMMNRNFIYKTDDNVEIYTHCWLPDNKSDIKAVVQISHGLAEHGGRYQRFAEALVDAGYAVYANDHRGHGVTAKTMENLGFFSNERGWDKVVADMHRLNGIIKKEIPRVPVFLFGHSMGSSLSRHYMMGHGDSVSGLILSGCVGNPGILGRVPYLIAQISSRMKGKKNKAPLVEKSVFGIWNRSFKPNRTKFDWLTRDSEEVDKYIEDPFCGVVGTAGLYCDVFKSLPFINRDQNVTKIPVTVPIFIISGSMDPVGWKTPWGGKPDGVLGVVNSFIRAGVKDVSYKIYNGCRHELLNEINRAEVFQDIIAWLNKHRDLVIMNSECPDKTALG
jgi:alpha-beta hydrolase superfamily lysophospholipase